MRCNGTAGDEPEQDTIGGRISLAREALDLSPIEAAGAVDVGPAVWSDWERDRSGHHRKCWLVLPRPCR